MVELTTTSEGTVLAVTAQAGASCSGLRGEQNGRLKVAVTQVAEKGKANKVLISTIAKALGLRKSQVELISGKSQPLKQFLVRDISVEALSERLQAAIGGD